MSLVSLLFSRFPVLLCFIKVSSLKQYNVTGRAGSIEDLGLYSGLVYILLVLLYCSSLVYVYPFIFTDRTAKIWDLNRGDEILSLAGHKRDVTVVRYSPTTKLVFTVNQSTIKVRPICLE